MSARAAWRELLLRGIVGGALAAGLRPARAGASETLLRPRLDGLEGLLTNEFAYWNRAAAGARRFPDWELTSGSLFARDGAAWTGVPDSRPVDALSSRGNNSAVFRLRTRRADLRDVSVSFALLNRGLSETPSTPAADWDGVHLWLRYQDETRLYAISVNRRDDSVVVKKKVPGGPSNGGSYLTLAGPEPFQVPYGRWQKVRATARDLKDGAVELALWVDGRRLLRAVDRGAGGPALRRPGRVGLRGDNAEFEFMEFAVESLSGEDAP